MFYLFALLVTVPIQQVPEGGWRGELSVPTFLKKPFAPLSGTACMEASTGKKPRPDHAGGLAWLLLRC